MHIFPVIEHSNSISFWIVYVTKYMAFIFF